MECVENARVDKGQLTRENFQKRVCQGPVVTESRREGDRKAQ